MAEYVLYSDCVEQTEQAGAKLASKLPPGTVVAMLGDLGAGKTAFVRGMAAGLGIKQRVTSPTFTIVNEYLGGRCPLFHFDLYRLSGEEELYDIGWEDYLGRGGICAVEWSERAPEAMEPCIRVEITPAGPEEEHRRIRIVGVED